MTPRFQTHCFSFAAGHLNMHENLMVCVILGNADDVCVSDGTHTIEAPAIAIRPGVPHTVDVQDGGAEIFYFDGVTMVQSMPDITALDSEWLGLASAFDAQDSRMITACRARLSASTLPPDPSVMRIVAHLYATSHVRMSQDDLARALGLERTQALRHFKASTGQTFRRFKKWSAIVAATRYALNGAQIGHAAMDAGFSDAAHLARSAASVFGVTPTQGLSGLSRLRSLPQVATQQS